MAFGPSPEYLKLLVDEQKNYQAFSVEMDKKAAEVSEAIIDEKILDEVKASMNGKKEGDAFGSIRPLVKRARRLINNLTHPPSISDYDPTGY